MLIFEGTDKIAAGILFKSGDDIFLIKKSDDEETFPSTWGIPGGHIEDGEDPLDAAKRETEEEIGSLPKSENTGESVSNDVYTMFIFDVPVEETNSFVPDLSPEHQDYGWFPTNDLPQNLQPKFKKEIEKMGLISKEEDEYFIGSIKEDVDYYSLDHGVDNFGFPIELMVN